MPQGEQPGGGAAKQGSRATTNSLVNPTGTPVTTGDQ
jgi:hypothetical protein